MDELRYDENEEDINLEDLEIVRNLNIPDSYDDGIFPSLDFMMDIDDE